MHFGLFCSRIALGTILVFVLFCVAKQKGLILEMLHTLTHK